MCPAMLYVNTPPCTGRTALFSASWCGTQVIVSGVVKAVNVDLAAGRGANRAKSLFLLYIDAVAATNVKAVTSAESGGSHVRSGCCSLARMRTHACMCLCVCLCVWLTVLNQGFVCHSRNRGVARFVPANSWQHVPRHLWSRNGESRAVLGVVRGHAVRDFS